MPDTDEIKALRTELQTLSTQAHTLYAELEQKGADAAAEDRQRLETLLADGRTKRAKLDTLLDLNDLKAISLPDNRVIRADLLPARMEVKTPGGLFTGEDRVLQETRNLISAKQNLGMDRAPAVVVGGLKALYDPGLETKDIYSTANTVSVTTPALTPPMYQPEILDIARQRPPSIIDLVPSRPTQSAIIEYVLYATRTNSAAVVPEYSSGNFGLKPQSDEAFDLKIATVKTIATWVSASNQILDDAPALRAQIDNELAYMVRVVLEDQILNGNGSGNNFTGIQSTSGIQTRVMSNSAPSGRGQTTSDTKADTLRRALTDIQLSFYTATGIVLAPADAEALELTKDSQGRYLMIFDPVTQQLWRTPTIVTAAETAGTALVGNFQIGCQLWDRMQTAIRIGQPSDYFLRNAVAILAELRAAFAVTRPLAFEKVTLV